MGRACRNSRIRPQICNRIRQERDVSRAAARRFPNQPFFDPFCERLSVGRFEKALLVSRVSDIAELNQHSRRLGLPQKHEIASFDIAFIAPVGLILPILVLHGIPY